MANAIYCSDNNTENIDFSGQTIPQGTFITATNAEPDPSVINYCFEITDSVSAAGSFTASTNTYTSCYECLINNYAVSVLEPCDSSTGLPNLQILLSEIGFIPSEGQVFYLIATNVGGTDEGTYIACYQFNSFEQTSEDNYNRGSIEYFTIDQIIHSNYSLVSGCEECLNGFSAGTESAICNVCYDGSGYTTTTVTAPHPTWTNGQGQAVVQLNAVTLGGPNGLNN